MCTQGDTSQAARCPSSVTACTMQPGEKSKHMMELGEADETVGTPRRH